MNKDVNTTSSITKRNANPTDHEQKSRISKEKTGIDDSRFFNYIRKFIFNVVNVDHIPLMDLPPEDRVLLCQLYLKKVQVYFEDLNRLVGTGDFKSLQPLFHTMVGTASTMGFNELSEKARELEGLCKAQLPAEKEIEQVKLLMAASHNMARKFLDTDQSLTNESN